jgi:hypothetical protein
MPKGYPLGLTPAVLEELGGQEGVQVDAELAAEAAKKTGFYFIYRRL